MKRIYQGRQIEISIYPSGKDQAEVGMYVDMERSGWKSSMFVPDSTFVKLVGREMYYSLVCELFPEDFQSRPNTPELVYKRVRRRSSASRSRRTPHEIGVEAEPYDKAIIDSVSLSSSNADTGECRLRVEKALFSVLQSDYTLTDSKKLWWDLKTGVVLLYVCLKMKLIGFGNISPQSIFSMAELFGIWKTRLGMSSVEMFYENDSTLTGLGQAICEAVRQDGFLYKVLGGARSEYWVADEGLGVQSVNATPDIDGHLLLETEQGKIVQVVLIVLLFVILVAGVGSFIAENKKVMRLLESLHEKCSNS
jgi:hypothetical protein